MNELLISKDLVTKLATCSLQGIAFEKGFTPGPLKIIFEGSSLSYCRQNGGPELLIMPDYVPFCILESVLEMQKNGWKIEVELKEID